MIVGQFFIWMVVLGVVLTPGRSTDVEAQAASGKEPRAIIDTKFGSIEMRFLPDKAPKHVENFITLAKSGLTPTSFAGFGKLVQGTRRHNLVYCDDLSAQLSRNTVQLTFALPAGSYATVLLQEITKNFATPADDDPSGH